jgi:hypothetical protein
MWSLDVPQPYGPPWPVTGIALPFSLPQKMKAIESEANQEIIEAIAEPKKWAPCIKAGTCVLPCRTGLLMFYNEPIKNRC